MFTFWLGRPSSQFFIFLFRLLFHQKVIIFIFCSASVDGRVFIWKINEGPDEEDKPQITGKIVIAIQIEVEGESVHPRVCWHPHKQVISFSIVEYVILYIFFVHFAFLAYFPSLLISCVFMVDNKNCFSGNSDGCNWKTYTEN